MNILQNIYFEMLVRSNQIANFVLGRGLFYRRRLEEDYRQWHALTEYYLSAGIKDSVKQKIKHAMLELFDAPGDESKYASLAMCRTMGINEITHKIVDYLRENELMSLSPALGQSLLCL